MVYKPKELPEDINITPVHPLADLAHLLATVVIASTIIYFTLGAIATQLAVRISPELETKIGKQLLSTVPTETKLDSQQRYLQSLLTSISTTTLDVPVTIHLQKSKYPNAMIIPGGHIIVTTALLEQAESENELAFVLAHELGHHVARDPLKALGRSLVFLTVASAIGIGSGNADIVTFTGSISDLHYSRKQESIADRYALSKIVNMYGHGKGSLDFFRRLITKNKNSGNKLTAYFSTHPLTQDRIKRLEQIAKQQQWQMTGEATKLPQNFD
jgi:predicted Zn-dependent protease